MRLMSLFACALLAFSCAETVRAPNADLAITNVTVIDGTGGPAAADRTVLIEDGRIAAVGPAPHTEVPADAEVIDGSGRFLIPGLWDMHVHAWSPSPFSEIFLRHGITSVREMGTGIEPMWGGSEGVWAWREAVRSGERIGPRVLAAGFILNGGDPEQQGAPFFKGVTSAAEGRQWVDSLADQGADFLKVYSALGPEAFAAIATRAEERGLRFSGHVPARVGTRVAVRQGLASLEHLYDVLVATSAEEDAIRAEIARELEASTTPTAAAQTAEKERSDRLIASHDPAKAEALFALFKEHGTWVSPTLLVNADPRCQGSPLPPVDEDFLADLPGYLGRFVQLPEVTPEDLAMDCRRFARLSGLTLELERAGVPLLAGSDAPNPGVKPGDGLHDELFLLVRAGLTPSRVLQIATRDAARFMGLEDALGTIEVGKTADLVLLAANPLEDIRHTRRIEQVVVNGEVNGPGD